MSKGLAFWIIMLILFVFSAWIGFSYVGIGYAHYFVGGNFVIFVLLFLLGWQVFGFPIR